MLHCQVVLATVSWVSDVSWLQPTFSNGFSADQPVEKKNADQEVQYRSADLQPCKYIG